MEGVPGEPEALDHGNFLAAGGEDARRAVFRVPPNRVAAPSDGVLEFGPAVFRQFDKRIGFEDAAGLYAAAVPGLAQKERSPLVYELWFNANLGASDLSYLTRQVEPNTNQIARIRQMILALPGEASERHMALMAQALSQSARQLKPELKPRAEMAQRFASIRAT